MRIRWNGDWWGCVDPTSGAALRPSDDYWGITLWLRWGGGGAANAATRPDRIFSPRALSEVPSQPSTPPSTIQTNKQIRHTFSHNWYQSTRTNLYKICASYKIIANLCWRQIEETETGGIGQTPWFKRHMQYRVKLTLHRDETGWKTLSNLVSNEF